MLSGDIGRISVKHRLPIGAIDLVRTGEVKITCLTRLVIGNVWGILGLDPVDSRHSGAQMKGRDLVCRQ